MHALHKLLLATALTTVAYSADLDVGIVNGREARPHSKPYMVSVQKNGRHICGGFLVSEYFVMTAAHCMKGQERRTVVVGAHDIPKKKSGFPIDVKFYHFHPGYNHETLENDIMLLQLEKKVQKNKAIQWIPLPKKDKDIKAKSICNVAGWGANTTNGPAMTHLFEANVTIMDSKMCQKYWGKHLMASSMLCASGDAGFCQGDSGGPLVCKGTAVGVVSFNEKGNCNKPTKPNVYTKISKYIPWIKAIIESIK